VNTKIAAALVVAIIGTLAGVYFGREFTRPTAPPAPVATSLESLFSATFADLDGKEASLAPWRDEILVVNFWATWCPPCRDEMPDLSRLQERHKGVRFVGVALDAPAKVKAFSERHPVAYPLLIASGDTFALSRELGNAAQALPYTLVVKNDKIKWAKLGRIDATQLDSYLSALPPNTRP